MVVGVLSIVRRSEGLPNGVQQSLSFLVQVTPERNVGRTNEVTSVKYIIHRRFLSDDHVSTQTIILNRRCRDNLPPVQNSLIHRRVKVRLQLNHVDRKLFVAGLQISSQRLLEHV